jgi:hypothetical protein
MGERAVQRVLERIGGLRSGPETLLLPAELLVRPSSDPSTWEVPLDGEQPPQSSHFAGVHR